MDEKLKNELIGTVLRLKKAKSGFFSGGNISWEVFMFLQKLNEEGNAGSIGEMLGITRPAVTYMLNYYEKQGYITRSIDSTDRRRIDIKLTAKGKRNLAFCKKTHDVFFSEIFARFGDDNARDFIRLFNRFIDVMEEVREDMKNV